MKDQIVIISAELDSKSNDDNEVRTNRLRELLNENYYNHGIFGGIEKVLETYNGKKRTCFIVKLQNIVWNTELEILKGYAFKNFAQDNVVYSDNRRHSELHSENGFESLGRLESLDLKQLKYDSLYYTKEQKVNGKVTDKFYYGFKK
jgi:hypothetical protein